MSTTTQAEILFRPDPLTLGFLPEGPLDLGDGRFSWVGIQNGLNAATGSLNRFDLRSRTNICTPLGGRPGFAIADGGSDRFIVGIERSIVRVTLDDSGALIDQEVLCDTVDTDVDGTIINDGVAIDGGVIFGCKDLQFKEAKAGLYFWNQQTQTLVQLRHDQTCSNGKVVLEQDARSVTFLDIDTPTRQVMQYELDLETNRIVAQSRALDLASEIGFPDGMIGTPDGQGVIVAFFNPDPAEHGIAKWIDLASGQTRLEWHTEGSPQVTCPMLIDHEGGVGLVLTTAAENMSADQRDACPNAGCLFLAETPFTF